MTQSSNSLSGTSLVFYNLYHAIGPFTVWLMGIFTLLVGCSALFSISDSWQTFYFLTLTPYIVVLLWALPLTRIGSWKAIVPIVHRTSGILSLLLPMALASYEAWTKTDPPVEYYLFSIVCISFNCIFGAFLIPKRIPSYDVPTIRAFGVGVTLGLSFVGWSLVWYFGKHKWFEPIGYAFAIYSIVTCMLAWNDSIKHIYTNMTNPYYATQLDLEYFKPPKRASEVGLKHTPYSVTQVFTEFPFKANHPKLQEVTVTPSSAAVVFTVTLTAIFSLTTLVQIHYLKCGSAGAVLREQLYPNLTRHSAYLSLLAAVANNFGTFAGTLVVQQKVSSFWGAFFNAIGLLIPVVASLALQLRVPHEDMLSNTLLLKCSM